MPVGRLVLVATPIGNLGDLSPRAVEGLREADVVAAEDTRRTGRLLAHAGLDRPLTSYHEHNEASQSGRLLDRVARGETVAVVTDAGTPGISDPGHRLVREAVARDLPVEAVPGPVAAVHALVLSGLPTDRFAMEGFLPRKDGARAERIAGLAGDPRTLLFYVAPHRAADDLSALANGLGERPAALCRELTKVHEEVRRGTLGELAASVADGVRGELVLVVGGAPADRPEELTDAELVGRVRELVATGTSRKQAIGEVAKAAGVPKRRVYQAVLDAPR